MASVLGLLRILVRRGINLAVRDALTSDPYVVITMGEQKVKTSVMNSNCNPVWNERLTLSVKDPNIPIHLTVFDSDTLSADDKMGEAEIDIKPLLDNVMMGLQGLPNGTKVDRIRPNSRNCLVNDSRIIWNDGKLSQDMLLKLKNVECGELEIQIEWIEITGCTGLRR